MPQDNLPRSDRLSVVALVDSSDGSQGCLSTLMESLALSGTRLVVASTTRQPNLDKNATALECHEPGATTGKILNLAFDLLASEYVAIINTKMTPRENWLASFEKECLQTSPAMAGGRIISGGRVLTTGFVLSPDTELGFATRQAGLAQNNFEVLQKTGLFAPAAGFSIICREACVEVGLFSDELCEPFASLDMAIRLRQAGHQIVYCPKAIADAADGFRQLPEIASMTAGELGLTLESADHFYLAWATPLDGADRELRQLNSISARWMAASGPKDQVPV